MRVCYYPQKRACRMQVSLHLSLSFSCNLELDRVITQPLLDISHIKINIGETESKNSEHHKISRDNN